MTEQSGKRPSEYRPQNSIDGSRRPSSRYESRNRAGGTDSRTSSAQSRSGEGRRTQGGSGGRRGTGQPQAQGGSGNRRGAGQAQSQARRSSAQRQSSRASQGNPRRAQAAQGQPGRERTGRRGTAPIQNSDIPAQTKIIAGLAGLAIIAAVIAFFVLTGPIKVTVNGVEHDLGGGKNIDEIIKTGIASPQPGDLIAVDGELLEAGKGEALTAFVNGSQVSDTQVKLKAGDDIEISGGANTVEPSKDTDEVIPFQVSVEGDGPLHVLEGAGTDGVLTTKVGEISGKTATTETVAPQHVICRNYWPDTGGDLVIALTFDDGPWPESTSQILDLLKQYDAKATFFTIGKQCNENGAELVKRAFDEGHQVCTQSFSYGGGSNQGDGFAQLVADQQAEEVEKGRQTLTGIIGQEASRVFRLPEGDFTADIARALHSHITADIGWTIDSYDWRQFGAEGIASNITSAQSGDIILLHDGGGNRAQTIDALEIAIPYLIEQGYRFITIDELLAYPAA